MRQKITISLVVYAILLSLNFSMYSYISINSSFIKYSKYLLIVCTPLRLGAYKYALSHTMSFHTTLRIHSLLISHSNHDDGIPRMVGSPFLLPYYFSIQLFICSSFFSLSFSSSTVPSPWKLCFAPLQELSFRIQWYFLLFLLY